MGKHAKTIKVFKIIGDVVLYLFLAICIFGVIVTVVSKKDADGTATIFGYQVRFVQSASMEKCDETDVSGYKIKDIPVKSAVFIQTVPDSPEKAEKWYASLKPGDVLTFKYVYVRQETITHRIVNITPKADASGYLIELEGDNKSSDSSTLSQTIDTSLVDSPNYVIGKVTGVSYAVGLFVYALKTPVGIICIVILPCLIIIVLEVIRIVNAVNAGKKAKKKKEEEKQRDEMEELRRRIAELESGTKPSYDGKENNVETLKEE